MNLFNRTGRNAGNKLSVIMEAYHASRPPLSAYWFGAHWRYDSVVETLQYITDPAKYSQLKQQASDNLKRWKNNNKEKPPLMVEVKSQDWGVATQEVTQKTGIQYAVLNMANPKYPGGGFLTGDSAQEENLFQRTTCSLSLVSEFVNFDKEAKQFVYNAHAQNLLQAKIAMTASELAILSKCRGESIKEAYKVFYNPEVNVCFRGPEVRLLRNIEEIGSGNHPSAEPTMSFLNLSASQIFPFIEFRSAAPQCSFEGVSEDSDDYPGYCQDLRRRIAAQLDTLILQNQTHIVLGAWGCGAFKNKPELIANIYREEIEKRMEFFQHIIFPIMQNDRRAENYPVFYDALHGLELGNTLSSRNLLR